MAEAERLEAGHEEAAWVLEGSPELAARIVLHLPDEKTRRVGQAVAAAILPVIERREQ